MGGWALDMTWQMTNRGFGSYSFSDRYGIRDAMQACTNLINTGKMDDLLQDQQLFKETERILLDLVSGRQMAITMDEIYVAREEIIKAVQAFYFRAVRLSRSSIHPDIQAALKK